MKIGFNSTALLSPKSGIGQYVKQLSRHLLEEGSVDMNFYCGLTWSSKPSPGQVTSEFFKQFELVNKTFSEVEWINKPLKTLKGQLRQFAFSRGANKLNVDLYHEPNFISYRYEKPTIITVHDMSPFRLPEFHKENLVRLFNKKLPQSIKNAAAILVDSQFIRDEVIHYFPEASSKIFTINLAAGSEFSLKDFPTCNDYLTRNNLKYKNYILVVGTLEPRKNLISVVRAYAKFSESFRNNYPLVIAGMKGWLHSNFESEAKALILKGQIRLIGYVDDDKLPILYSGANVMVYPSIYEGFGLPPLEAMACGTPVITSNVASLPEVVGEGGVMVDPYDVELLKNAISCVVEDKTYALILAQKGLIQAQSFSWQKAAKQTIVVYSETLNKKAII